MKEKIFFVILVILLTLSHAIINRPVDHRYEVVAINESNYILIDHKENKIYQKYISPDSGPTEFEEIELPEK